LLLLTEESLKMQFEFVTLSYLIARIPRPVIRLSPII
jgi:hypothetical protein